jgi:hypothetical protein
MKNLNQYITEKLGFNKLTKINKKVYNYHPKNKYELKELIKQLIKERGNDADLNDIDVSKITDMSELFSYSYFNGDISNWDVSKVENMESMFTLSKFNQDISKWNVFNVKKMRLMFADSDFNDDISNWKINKKCNTIDMFYNCKIKHKYKPNGVK